MSNPRVFAGRLMDRAVIRLSPKGDGDDVREFLQGLVTQDTARISPETPLWSALLTPQGKVLFDFILFADPQAPLDMLIDTEAGRAEALVKRLSLYRLRRKIDIGIDDTLAVYIAHGQDSDAPADPRLDGLGHRWVASKSKDDTDASASYRQHRLSLGVTEGIAELGDGQTLWLECNAIELNGVSFTKGCYVGQENTARMNWRAKVNRRMVMVPMDKADTQRQRIAYPVHGVSVEHRRVEDLEELDLPDWLKAALMEAE